MKNLVPWSLKLIKAKFRKRIVYQIRYIGIPVHQGKLKLHSVLRKSEGVKKIPCMYEKININCAEVNFTRGNGSGIYFFNFQMEGVFK